MSCLCFRKVNRFREDKKHKIHFLYQRANDKLEKELDIVNLVRSIRKLRLISKILLPARNRLLLRFQKKNLIDSTSSSSDSDDYKYDTMKLLDSKKNLVKLSAMVKLKKQLNYYLTNNMEPRDKEILKGILTNPEYEHKNLEDQTQNPFNDNTDILKSITGDQKMKVFNSDN